MSLAAQRTTPGLSHTSVISCCTVFTDEHLDPVLVAPGRIQ